MTTYNFNKLFARTALTSKEVAVVLDVCPSLVNKWKRGANKPNRATCLVLESLATGLSVRAVLKLKADILKRDS